MLDENLPTFYLKPSKDSVKHDATLYLSQYGSEASPSYTIRHPDPASPDSRNRYAAALCDSYHPDIIFGEVLLIPEWTQPNPSQEDIRKNGGVPPPPQPILPNQFVIQLYNPDQQIAVRHHPSTWNSAQHWDFDMPQQTFRQPSASTLDRTQSDPTVSEATPKIEFKWKREGKLSKDLLCNLSGKTRNPDGSKRRNKEPDIPMAFFRNLREMTIYEPNLSRIDIEDPKGFEVVLLLGAAVIKDIYFTPMRDAFNISEASRPRGNSLPTVPPRRTSAGAKLPSQQPAPHPTAYGNPAAAPAQANGNGAIHGLHPHLQQPNHPSRPPVPTLQTPIPPSSSRPPPTDPRSQWEIDAETARLRKQVEAEERERAKRDKAETKRVRRMLEEEEKEVRRRRAEVDRETERLRREFEAEQKRAGKGKRQHGQQQQQQIPPRHSAPLSQGPYLSPQPQPQPQQYPYHSVGGAGGGGGNPYLQAPSPQGTAAVSSSGFFGGGGGGVLGVPVPPNAVRPKRSHFFGLRGGGEENTLWKKRSAIF